MYLFHGILIATIGEAKDIVREHRRFCDCLLSLVPLINHSYCNHHHIVSVKFVYQLLIGPYLSLWFSIHKFIIQLQIHWIYSLINSSTIMSKHDLKFKISIRWLVKLLQMNILNLKNTMSDASTEDHPNERWKARNEDVKNKPINSVKAMTPLPIMFSSGTLNESGGDSKNCNVDWNSCPLPTDGDYFISAHFL
mgnify:CR=1 FL=1